VARYLVIKPISIAFAGYTSPGRSHYVGQTLELSPAEVTVIGAGNLRAVSAATYHDQLGEAVGVSNGS
jgi:hypothetical protein